MHTRTHARMHAHRHTYTHACIHTLTHKHTHTYKHVIESVCLDLPIPGGQRCVSTVSVCLDLPVLGGQRCVSTVSVCLDLPVPGGQRCVSDGVSAGGARAAAAADAQPLPVQAEGQSPCLVLSRPVPSRPVSSRHSVHVTSGTGFTSRLVYVD